jgi:hypothetical protein
MRFMVIVKGDETSAANNVPSEELLIAMGKFNEEMIKAGVMLSGEGLQPSSKGAKVQFGKGGKRTVVDGPFTEARELVGGFWILSVKSKAEAIEWAKRIPFDEGEVEIRQVSEAEDFQDAVKTEAGKATLAAEIAFRDKQARS